MKKIKFCSIFVFSLILGFLIFVQIGNAEERGFFDNTLDYDTQFFKMNDYTCSTLEEPCYFIISIKINTLTEHLSVLDAKDLFIQIKVFQQDIRSNITSFNVADVYIEQVIDGGRYGGIPFDQSSAFIGDFDLPQVTKEIPYNYHVGLDGCDLLACIDYREAGALTLRHGDWFTNLQINIEIQLYIDIPEEFGVSRYQDYIYLPINDQLEPVQNQASQSFVPFSSIGIFFGIAILAVAAVIYKNRKR